MSADPQARAGPSSSRHSTSAGRPSASAGRDVAGPHNENEISETVTNEDAKRTSTSDGTRKGSKATLWDRKPWDKQRELDKNNPEAWKDHPGLRLAEPDAEYAAMKASSEAPPAPAATSDGPPYPYGRYDDAAHPAASTSHRPRAPDEENQYASIAGWKRDRKDSHFHGISRTQSFGTGHAPEGRGRRHLGRLRHPHDHHHDSSDSASDITLRLPFLNWLGWTAKGHVVAFLGELVGTTMFLFFAFAGAEAATVQPLVEGNPTSRESTGFNAAVLLYISLVFGFSLMINVWIFYRVSGGLFNPAVTFGMALVRSVTVFRASLLVVAQLVGSIIASVLVKYMFPSPFNAKTKLSPETSLTRGVFIEAILTAELVFTIFMLAKEKHKATFLAPVGIGLSFFIAELVGVYYTGASLNPARSFGPCVVAGSFNREHWIYWVGPGLGALVAVVFYKFILIMQYELANPGQDESSEQGAAAAAEEAKVIGERTENGARV